MQVEQVSHMVAASVTPVVVISAASLLCLAFYNRLAALVTRLRSVQRERLEIQERLERPNSEENQHASLRYTCLLESLTEQSIGIIRRARTIRLTLFSLLASIAFLVVCSLLTGLTILWANAVLGAVGCFALGMVFMLVAVVSAAVELHASLSPAELEIDVVSELTGFSTTLKTRSLS